MVVPALAVALAAPLALPEARAERPIPPDVPGALLATAGAVAVLFATRRARR
jgi:hypothetical protein